MLIVFITLWSIESQPNYQSLSRLNYLNVIDTSHYWGFMSIKQNFEVLYCLSFKCFVGKIIRNFRSTFDAEDSFIIPPGLFGEDKPVILIDLFLCKERR